MKTRMLFSTAAMFAALLQCATARSQQPAAPAVIVKVAAATSTRLSPQRWVPGSVVSRDDARIATSSAGRIESVAEVGTRLRAGERLAKLDDASLRLRQEEIETDVRRNEAQRALAETQLARLQKLAAASNSVAATQLDEARAQLEMRVQDLAHARAQLHQVAHDIEQSELRAPFDGIVTERFAQRGEYLQTGAAVVHLVDIDHVEARVQAPLALLGSVRNGLVVAVKAGGQERPATVRAVVPVGDERSRQFELRVALERASALVGSAIEVALPESAGNETLTVPRDAIVLRQDGSYVMRVGAKNIAERVAVTTGARRGDLVEVEGQLSVGDQLVVRGAERLNAGQTVRVDESG